MQEVRKLIPKPVMLAAILTADCMVMLEYTSPEEIFLVLTIFAILYLSVIHSSNLPFIEIFSTGERPQKKQKIFKILVGTDGSSLARKAVEYATSLAIQNKGEVLLLHVVGVEPEAPPSIWATPEVKERDRKYIEGLKAAGESLLKEESSRIAERGVKVVTRIEFGSPAEKILEVAEREKVDMIVLGVRGISRWKRLILGSVSEKVLEKSRIPVLIVR